MIAAELGMRDGELGVSRAADEHRQSLDQLNLAQSGWQAHLEGTAIDPGVLGAWQRDITVTAANASEKKANLDTASETLDILRHAWLDARRHHDLARERDRAARLTAARTRDERTLGAAADMTAQRWGAGE